MHARTHSSQKQGSRALMFKFSSSETDVTAAGRLHCVKKTAESSSNVLQHRLEELIRRFHATKPNYVSRRREKRKEKQNVKCSVL